MWPGAPLQDSGRASLQATCFQGGLRVGSGPAPASGSGRQVGWEGADETLPLSIGVVYLPSWHRSTHGCTDMLWLWASCLKLSKKMWEKNSMMTGSEE